MAWLARDELGTHARLQGRHLSRVRLTGQGVQTHGVSRVLCFCHPSPLHGGGGDLGDGGDLGRGRPGHNEEGENLGTHGRGGGEKDSLKSFLEEKRVGRNHQPPLFPSPKDVASTAGEFVYALGLLDVTSEWKGTREE